MQDSYKHISVMPEEILEGLRLNGAEPDQQDKVYVDATLGGAGHSKLILEKLNGKGHLYSFDQDINVIKKHQAAAATHPKLDFGT